MSLERKLMISEMVRRKDKIIDTYGIWGRPRRKVEVESPHPRTNCPSLVGKTWHFEAMRMAARIVVCTMMSSSIYKQVITFSQTQPGSRKIKSQVVESEIIKAEINAE